VATLPNYLFELKLEQPLDPARDHTLTVRGFDLRGQPVRLEGRAAASNRTSVALSFTKDQLQKQQDSLAALQSPPGASGAPSASLAPSSAAAAGTAAGSGWSGWGRIVLIFVILLILVLAGYLAFRMRRPRS